METENQIKGLKRH